MVEQRAETSTAHRSGTTVATKLLCIGEKAGKEPQFQFTSLYHLMNEELLRDCFERLNGKAVAGIDGIDKQMYAENLEANLTKLVERLQRMAYIPQPVMRVYIPKPGTNKQRPLGIPCLEDKLVQAGLVRILEAIYEQDFIEGSFGYRPGRSCHDALRELNQNIEKGATNYIAEADIRGFFDNVRHDWVLKFLSHRIADTRILRMVKRFLKAGIIEEGINRDNEIGTPQGGSISPLISNIYLHYVLDLWFEKVYRSNCKAKADMIRYCDDFVVCFQNKEDAMRFQEALTERLRKFGLEVEPTKTQVLEFGSRAASNAKARGEKAKTFDFLGLTHYCSKARDGKRFRVKRITVSKKLRAKIATFKQWMKKARIKPIKWIITRVSAKLQGHYAYYGVSDNYRGIARYAREVKKTLFKWLNRRSDRRSFRQEEFNQLLKLFPLPNPRIRVSLL